MKHLKLFEGFLNENCLTDAQIDDLQDMAAAFDWVEEADYDPETDTIAIRHDSGWHDGYEDDESYRLIIFEIKNGKITDVFGQDMYGSASEDTDVQGTLGNTGDIVKDVEAFLKSY